MKAADLDFDSVPHFSAGEFPVLSTALGPCSVLEFVDAALIRALSRFREALGASVTPSPLAAGWVREGGSTGSRHYVGPIQRNADGDLQSRHLGDAGDVFPEGDIRTAWLTALAMTEFGGVGVYFDTRGPSGTPQPMLHLDLRPGPRVLWLRDNGQYLYPAAGDAAVRRFLERLSAA